MRVLMVVLTAALALGGCASTYNEPMPQYWLKDVRKLAPEAFLYAQMSENAYAKKPEDARYKLEGAFEELNDLRGENVGGIGLDYTVYRRVDGICPAEIVIAFRGTEGVKNRLDMWFGNLQGRQNAKAEQVLRTIDNWRRQNMPEARITVAGHSLGGGIATHLSINYDNIDSFAFDSSPRYALKERRRRAVRHLVVERGEILYAARALGRHTDRWYTSLNCMSGFDPVQQHDMEMLANCLTAAAAWDNTTALRSMERNAIPGLDAARAVHRPVTERTCADQADARPPANEVAALK